MHIDNHSNLSEVDKKVELADISNEDLQCIKQFEQQQLKDKYYLLAFRKK